MSREYGVEECACGLYRCVIRLSPLSRTHASLKWITDNPPQEVGGYMVACAQFDGFCTVCNTKLGIDELRGPWRERMVPKSALEALVRIRQARQAVPRADVFAAHVAEVEAEGYLRDDYIRDGIAALLDWLSGATVNSRWSRWMVEDAALKAAERGDDDET